MKTFSRLMILALLLPACAPDSLTGGFYILAGQAVSPKTQCMAKAGGGATEIRSVGVMDLMMTSDYTFYPIVRNEMDPLEATTGQNSETGYLESNPINIKGAWVTYSIEGLQGPWDGDGKSKLPETFVPTSGTVDSDGGVTTVAIQVIPAWIGSVLDRDKAFDAYLAGGYMTLGIKLEGETLDGTTVRSSTFNFPVIVCRACLIGIVLGGSEDDLEVPFCSPGQDYPIPGSWAIDLISMWQPERWDKKVAMLEGLIRSLDETIPAGTK